jgi:hypothetical protein
MQVHPQVAGFILFCVQHRGKKWPELYDEMCRVAGRGLFQGLHYKELRKLGLSLSLNHIEETISMVEAVTNHKFDNRSLEQTVNKS